MQQKADYCPKCRTAVAPADPQKVTKPDGVYHNHCWKTVKQLQDRLVEMKLNLANFRIQ